MNHIVVIGFMGSGKTRVGKRLSSDLGLTFVDVDKVIVRKMNMPVKEIFLIEDKEKKVISLGAGLPIQEQNEKYIKQLGTVVYLKGSAETFRKRLEGNNNPLLEGDNQEEKIKKLLKQRDPIYHKFADIEVVTGVKPFEELIKEIESKLP